MSKFLNLPLDTKWQTVEIEFENAVLARKNGNEGKARVCARRAVSNALFVSGISNTPSLSAIQAFTENLIFPKKIRRIAASLLQKVDTNYDLPPDVDLIQNAQEIISFLQSPGTANPNSLVE